MKKLAKHDPPRTLNIPARPLYFIYYSAQPMSWAIIILSIFCSLGCFFVIPPHRANNAVHLHIADQLIFSYTTPLGFFTFISRPLFFFLFFSFTWDYHRHIPFFSRFFLSLIFKRLWSYSPGFLYSFPYTVTSQKVLVLYDSFFFAGKIHPRYNIIVSVRHPVICFHNYSPDVIWLFKHDPGLTQLFTHGPWRICVFSNTTPDWLNYLLTAPDVLTYPITSPILFIFMHTPQTVIFVQLHHRVFLVITIRPLFD